MNRLEEDLEEGYAIKIKIIVHVQNHFVLCKLYLLVCGSICVVYLWQKLMSLEKNGKFLNGNSIAGK